MSVEMTESIKLVQFKSSHEVSENPRNSHLNEEKQIQD